MMPSWKWLQRHAAPEPGQPVKMVVGLGNPGQRYARSRHNVGFQVVDRVARANDLVFSRKRFRAQIAEANRTGERVILVKPQTFMNSSGEAVGKLYTYYRIAPENLLVIYDDLDLPLGKIRLRPKGSSGGHHGMESIISHIHTSGFPRLRMGIGRPNPEADINHVLGAFLPEERRVMEKAIDRAAEAVGTWVKEGMDTAMNKFNSDS